MFIIYLNIALREYSQIKKTIKNIRPLNTRRNKHEQGNATNYYKKNRQKSFTLRHFLCASYDQGGNTNLADVAYVTCTQLTICS